MANDTWTYRVRNEGDSTYYRPDQESAQRAALECLSHYSPNCRGTIEHLQEGKWTPIAAFQSGRGIRPFVALKSQPQL